MRNATDESSLEIFRLALTDLNKTNIPFVIGGAFAFYFYGGEWRNTHDLDLYVVREHVPSLIDALTKLGFRDYGEQAAGDREWIYHAMKDDTLIDIIWQPPHHLSAVDETFYTRGRDGEFLDIPVRFMPPDELVWSKIFTMNRHRCDWPDVFQIVRSRPADFDWHYLVRKMNDNWPVLLSFIILFDWAYPGEADCIPPDIRDDLIKQKSKQPMPTGGMIRESLLDPWIYSRPMVP